MTENYHSNIKWRSRTSAMRAKCAAYIICVDVICILLGIFVSVAVRDSFFGKSQWFILPITIIPIYFIIAFNFHAFASDAMQDPFVAIRRGVKSLIFSIAAVIFVAFALKTSQNLPRLVTAASFVFSTGLMAIGRYLFVRHLETIVGGNPFSVVLICDGEQPIPAGRFSVMLATDAYIDPDTHDPAMYDRLAKVLQGADRVVVACTMDRRLAWAHALKGACIQGEIVVPELAALKPLGVGHHGEIPTMVVAVGALDWFDRVIKRTFDVVLASSAVILFSPLLIIVSIAIKFDSQGPIIFKQTRIGRGNEMFKVFKFRSMRANLSDILGHRSATRDDDRITRIGRIIRSTSIDELPQLFNVIKGDMSIVGPRPHALGSRAAEKLFWEVDQRYWHRHAARPGLTGLAQVRGFRGATIEEKDLRNRLQADLEYVENWSIWRDIKIIFLTFRVILHRNAF